MFCASVRELLLGFGERERVGFTGVVWDKLRKSQ
jgi:hypothetical protein